MENTITIHKIYSGFANVPNTYNVGVAPSYLNGVDGKASDDMQVILPDGYKVAYNIFEVPLIFNSKNEYCEIVDGVNGLPFLVDGLHGMLALKLVKDNDND